jgi:hypothetical protein
MAYVCKQCGNKSLEYVEGSNGTRAQDKPIENGYYVLDCSSCENKEVHQFKAPQTIQEQLQVRVLQDF